MGTLRRNIRSWRLVKVPVQKIVWCCNDPSLVLEALNVTNQFLNHWVVRSRSEEISPTKLWSTSVFGGASFTLVSPTYQRLKWSSNLCIQYWHGYISKLRTATLILDNWNIIVEMTNDIAILKYLIWNITLYFINYDRQVCAGVARSFSWMSYSHSHVRCPSLFLGWLLTYLLVTCFCAHHVFTYLSTPCYPVNARYSQPYAWFLWRTIRAKIILPWTEVSTLNTESQQSK